MKTFYFEKFLLTFFAFLKKNQGKKYSKTARGIFEEAQENAKSDQVGIWGKGMKLVSQSSPTKVKKFERIQIEMTDITDANRFFIRILGDNQYSKIDNELDKFNAFSSEDLERPI